MDLIHKDMEELQKQLRKGLIQKAYRALLSYARYDLELAEVELAEKVIQEVKVRQSLAAAVALASQEARCQRRDTS